MLLKSFCFHPLKFLFCSPQAKVLEQKHVYIHLQSFIFKTKTLFDILIILFLMLFVPVADKKFLLDFWVVMILIHIVSTLAYFFQFYRNLSRKIKQINFKVSNSKRKFDHFYGDKFFFPLPNIGDFSRAWDVLLDHIQSAALSKNNEVSLAALKSFQEILQIVTQNTGTSPLHQEAYATH